VVVDKHLLSTFSASELWCAERVSQEVLGVGQSGASDRKRVRQGPAIDARRVAGQPITAGSQ
jgi:hypothetical protein